MDTTTEHGGGEFRKTATIRATQWWKMGDHPAVYLRLPLGDLARRDGPTPWIDTLEGGHVVTTGDWIATGVKGEHWPIKADVFAETYEPLRPAQPVAPDPTTTEHGGGRAISNSEARNRRAITVFLDNPERRDEMLDLLLQCSATADLGCEINPETMKSLVSFREAAYYSGIDTIAIDECGLPPTAPAQTAAPDPSGSGGVMSDVEHRFWAAGQGYPPAGGDVGALLNDED